MLLAGEDLGCFTALLRQSLGNHLVDQLGDATVQFRSV